MAAAPHPLRTFILTLLRRGEVVGIAEACAITGISRQTLYRWVRAERIDMVTARARCLARLHDRGQRIMDGKAPRRGPTKSEMRRMGEKAVRDFNRANRR